LQAAHDFLLSQFLSSVSNQRDDDYGGSLHNRIRLIIEIAAEIRKRVSPQFVLGIKINSVDFQQGFSANDARALCESLEAAHFDYVELSSGSVETKYAEVSGGVDDRRESTKARESFFLNFTDQIVAPLSQVKTYVTGGFKTVGGMVDALRSVDGVGLVRAACQEPRLPSDILAGSVTGAIKRLLDDQHWGITTVAAGAQIRQLSKDEEPFDQSVQANADSFLVDFDVFLESFGKEADENKYGFLDSSQPAQPYGGAILAP
jgi:2,4-dienoyl-CoA reductase-like NADH-dependent reductase (Old Yellow Enzyme family)